MRILAGKGTCAYCEKEGIVVPIRGLPGSYHLKCIKNAKEAWESARGTTFFERLFR